MAKIYGLFGSMTGKLAETVMSVRNGEQIARKYQPVVFNPSTTAQVAQRAKMKLLSQLSAVMAPVIAIPREGSVSSRNLFTKKNFPLTTYATDNASITLSNVQLTKSVVGIPPVTLYRDSDSELLKAIIVANNIKDYDKVVFCFFKKNADNSLEYLTSQVISNLDASGNWEADITLIEQSVVVLAYGVRLNTDNARAVFADMVAMTAEQIAKVVVTRTVLESDVTLSKTVGSENPAAPTNAITPAPREDENRTSKKN